jgi:hypothetical protein
MVLIVILVIVAPAYAVYIDIFTIANGLRLVNIIVSAILTVALVYLYYQQQQILESQVDLKRSELSGALYVNDYSSDEDPMEIILSNLSGFEVSDLRLRTEIFPQEIGEKKLDVSNKRLQRADEHETQFGRVPGLAPREQNVPFTGTPTVEYTDDDGTKIPELTFFIIELRDAEVEEVQLRMWVEGTDQLDQTVRSKVFPRDQAIPIDTVDTSHQDPSLDKIFQELISGSIDNSESEY